MNLERTYGQLGITQSRPRMRFVTPKNCTFTFLGLVTGQIYEIEGYVADVDKGNVRFDSGAGASATSADFWTPPEDCQLRDYAQVAGPTVTSKLRLAVNGVNTPGLLRYEAHLSTSPFRSPLSLYVPAGSRFSAVELA